uniref:Uncharacterized protein n=1 Tax=Anguilla anguilla TaxID=7936 RepID=A0A0E9QXQ0_ANGAN
MGESHTSHHPGGPTSGLRPLNP